MKFFAHDLKDSERCYVTVRINGTEYRALRKWMKTAPEQPCVSFVHGVRLERRSMGWYRLNPSNVFRGAEKLAFAFAILRKFAHEYQRDLIAEARRKRVLTAQPNKHIAAFVSTNDRLGGGEYIIRSSVVSNTEQHAQQQPIPASTQRLLALQQHFRK